MDVYEAVNEGVRGVVEFRYFQGFGRACLFGPPSKSFKVRMLDMKKGYNYD